ncbi:MAG: translation initiation factor IF-2 subunit gamma [Candidatus Micrarchaeaceae archaeon]
MDEIKQSVLNIETLGHIDHGKTSLTRALTGVWTDKHSESIKRNMTIKLGYADTIIRKCEKCPEPEAYTTSEVCPKCGGPAKPVIRVSLLDAPGHETLMATAIAGASVIDAVLFVIAANEPCPAPQTKEHMMIINLLGLKDVIIAQTKIDIVGKEKALESYNQIKAFIKGTIIEDAPIIPVMTNKGVNIDMLLQKIIELPRPKRDLDSDPLMYVVRSFDVNRPGADVSKLVGGVIGGTIVRGKFKKGDEIEIRPGINISKDAKKDDYKAVTTTIRDMNNGNDELDEAIPGGLIGISTGMDPAFVKADNLVGNVVGHVGKLPEARSAISMKYSRIARDDIQDQGLHEGEALIMGVGTATVVGFVKKARKDKVDVEFKHKVCIEKGEKIAILRNMSQRWRLTGYGMLQ